MKKKNNIGKNNPAWKGGNPDCLDCGKKLSRRRYIRCKSCSVKGKLNNRFGKHMSNRMKNRIRKKLSGKKCHLYIDGRASKQYYCKCGNKISYPTWLTGKRKCNTCKSIGTNNPNFGKKWTKKQNKERSKCLHKHHIDCNHNNNVKKNEIYLTLSEHMKAHGSLNKLVKKLMEIKAIYFSKKYKIYKLK